MSSNQSSTDSHSNPTTGKKHSFTNDIVISLEGNIGAGKSTFLKILKNELDICYVPEQVEMWKEVENGKDVNLLKLLYEDPKRWSFTFQMYAYFTRLKTWMYTIPTILSKRQESQILISERSLNSDKYYKYKRFVFGKHSLMSGSFCEAEWVTYLQFFDTLTPMVDTKINGYIYLNSSPETCLARIQKRGRPEEGSMNLAFLTELHDVHESWLRGKDSSIQTGAPILEIDTDQEFEYNSEHCHDIVTKVKDFIHDISSTKLNESL